MPEQETAPPNRIMQKCKQGTQGITEYEMEQGNEIKVPDVVLDITENKIEQYTLKCTYDNDTGQIQNTLNNKQESENIMLDEQRTTIDNIEQTTIEQNNDNYLLKHANVTIAEHDIDGGAQGSEEMKQDQQDISDKNLNRNTIRQDNYNNTGQETELIEQDEQETKENNGEQENENKLPEVVLDMTRKNIEQNTINHTYNNDTGEQESEISMQDEPKDNIEQNNYKNTGQETELIEQDEQETKENNGEQENEKHKQVNERIEMDKEKNDQENFRTTYDVFGDGVNIFKKYRLREPKKPSTVKPEDFNSDSIPEPYACPLCKFTTNTKLGLRNHMKVHPSERRFLCSLCDDDFATNSALIEHKETHSREDHTFLCYRCKLAFSCHQDYLQHMVEHTYGPPYRCKECSKTLSTKEGFKIHINTHFDNSIVCQKCGKEFKSEDRYCVHLKTHDKEQSSVKCGECGKLLKTAERLKYHMVSHTGVKLHQCIYCGKGFANDSQRTIHTRIHIGVKPYECTTCYQKFTQTTTLNRHMVTHMTEKRVKCEHCGKKFFHKESMLAHARSHTRMNVYPCLECDKQCTTRGALRSHVIFKHTREKLHWCDVCKVGFKMENKLHRHNATLRHCNKVYGAMRKVNELNDS